MSSSVIPGRLSAADPDLTDRQRRVFARLVALHRRDARPVSSERLARAADVRQSGARMVSACKKSSQSWVAISAPARIC